MVDGRLEFRVEAEGLGETAVLGGVYLAVRHHCHEIVLHRLGVVLAREGGGCLASPREADSQYHPVAFLGWDHLAAGVEGQPPPVVDELVPHPEAALLGLAEVVGVDDTGDVALEVDRDDALFGVTHHCQVGRIDDGDLRLEVLAGVFRRVEEDLLHAGDVGVVQLDDEASRGPKLWDVADVAVDDEHLLLGDVLVLHLGETLGLSSTDALLGVG